MTPEKYHRFAVHEFRSADTASFSPVEYSRLKFGCDKAAKKFGYELATTFFNAHSDSLLANDCVVISSPYNFIPNAATVMTQHFINKMNELLVTASGKGLEYTIIHRKVSYINDYGFLSKEKRRGLIDNDEFHLNRDFIKGKLLIFIDDVRITGTHENKLKEIMERDGVENQAFFIYYASYQGNVPSVEASLNFAAVSCIDDYLEMTKEEDHHVIIRPIKYILGQTKAVLKQIVPQFTNAFLDKVYYGCLAEGYYKIPNYQKSFGILVDERSRRTVK